MAADPILNDCYAVIQMHLPITADACSAARATIRAAEIQAKASRYSGEATFLAGILALMAAILAAWATVHSAKTALRHEREASYAKSRAYFLKLLSVLVGVKKEASNLRVYFENLEDISGKDFMVAQGWPEPVPPLVFHQMARKALSLSKWDETSLLPVEALEPSVRIWIAANHNIGSPERIEQVISREKELITEGKMEEDEILEIMQNRVKLHFYCKKCIGNNNSLIDLIDFIVEVNHKHYPEILHLRVK